MSLARFLQNRYSRKSFFGLPLTLSFLAFLFAVGLLLDLTEDFVHSESIVMLDMFVTHALFAFRSPELLNAFYICTLFAQTAVVVPVAALLSIFLWVERQRVLVATLWISLGMSAGTTFIAKVVFHRLRPDVVIRAIAENSFSYPSGHATAAVAFYGFLAYLCVRTQRSWSVKILAIAFAAIMIVLIDASRLYLGVHYLSDVLAGNLVGLIGLLIAIDITEWFLWKKPGKPTLRRTSLLATLCIKFLLIGGIVLLGPSPWVQAF